MHTARKALVLLGLMAGLASAGAQAATITDWTFETSIPLTAGPVAAEIGTGSASSVHAGASTYSSPAGNGSAHSFSSTNWLVGDYYQFSTSTTGFNNISVSWDQTSSNTGPRDFKLSYSTDGVTFTDLVNYSVLANGGAPNAAWNATTGSAAYTFTQSSVALANQALMIFRLTDIGTVSANGGVVASAGTNRVDNFIVSGTSVSQVPVPAALWLLGSGLVGVAGIGRRRRAA